MLTNKINKIQSFILPKRYFWTTKPQKANKRLGKKNHMQNFMETDENPTHKWLNQKRMKWFINQIEAKQDATRFDQTLDPKAHANYVQASKEASQLHTRQNIEYHVERKKAEKCAIKASAHKELWPDYLKQNLHEFINKEETENDNLIEAKLACKLNIKRQYVNIIQNEDMAREFRIKERFMKIMHKELKDYE